MMICEDISFFFYKVGLGNILNIYNTCDFVLLVI